jgi:hypothetical protein
MSKFEYNISDSLMVFYFFNFILNLRINVRIMHHNGNLYLKNHEDNFDERHRLHDRFEVIYLK